MPAFIVLSPLLDSCSPVNIQEQAEEAINPDNSLSTHFALFDSDWLSNASSIDFTDDFFMTKVLKLLARNAEVEVPDMSNDNREYDPSDKC